MGNKLYVGNLSFNTTANELEDLFSQHGPVQSVDLIMDKVTARPRGFGFVTMQTDESAQAAIAALNGANVGGRNLTVNEARPREERAPRSFGGGGGGGGGRREGGYGGGGGGGGYGGGGRGRR
jgi:RNA recognition motif-containing protein